MRNENEKPLGSKYEPLAALISAWAQSQHESLEAFKKAAEAATADMAAGRVV